ncbi:MAG TPA: NHL repeat-containing protein [Chroococcales cyanobacterium]
MRFAFRVLFPVLLLLASGCEYSVNDPALKRIMAPTSSGDNSYLSGSDPAAIITTPTLKPGNPASGPRDSYLIYTAVTGLNDPTDVAFDNNDNLFIAERGSQRIRKVSPQGRMDYYAGDGFQDQETHAGRYNGDGDALKMSLYGPCALAVDHDGNLFVADSYNQRVREVTKESRILTIAGNGEPAYVGDGKAATAASLKLPAGLAIDPAGNLYVADSGNHRIRMVDQAGIMSTVVGKGIDGFTDNRPRSDALINYPAGISFDNLGNLYIADRLNHRIRKVDLGGTITTMAGNGTATGPSEDAGDNGLATEASLSYPQDVVVDRYGFLYIADTGHHRIRRVDPQSKKITTIAGNGFPGVTGDSGPAIDARLNFPCGLAVDADGCLYVADSSNNRIRKLQ